MLIKPSILFSCASLYSNFFPDLTKTKHHTSRTCCNHFSSI